MNFDVDKVIDVLMSKNKLFVSERHLQVEFIIAAKKIYPMYEYIPEYVFHHNYHIDLVVTNGKDKIAFEFKYVVAGGIISVAGDNNYHLRNQSAIDVRRYQCVNDVSRLETYINGNDNFINGYFLLITNMKRFWIGSKENGVDKQFDICDGSCLKKGSHEAFGNNRFAKDTAKTKIILNNDYKIKYKDYLNSKDDIKFKYLLIRV